MTVFYPIIMPASRSTRQKKLLAQTIKSISTFFSADDVHNTISKTDPSIGIATIYRFLNNELQQGRLHRYLCDRRYVFSTSQTHCHYIDETTGEITHFSIDSIDFLKGKLPGDISSIHIEVKGKRLT